MTPRYPQTSEPIVTKICIRDYVVDVYPCAKFHCDRTRGFCPDRGEVTNHVFLLLFWSLLSTAKAAEPILTLNTSIGVVLRKDVPFGGPENKILYFDPNFPQKRKFWRNFRLDLENFGSKLGLTWRAPRVNTP